VGDDLEADDLDKVVNRILSSGSYSDLEQKVFDMKVLESKYATPMVISKRLLDDSAVAWDNAYSRVADDNLRRQMDEYERQVYPARQYVHHSRPTSDPVALDKYWTEKNSRDIKQAHDEGARMQESHLVVKHVAEMTAAMVIEDPYDEEGYADAVAFNDGLRRAILIVSEHLTLTAGSEPSIIGSSADT